LLMPMWRHHIIQDSTAVPKVKAGLDNPHAHGRHCSVIAAL
jgi:hypothetical protein